MNDILKKRVTSRKDQYESILNKSPSFQQGVEQAVKIIKATISDEKKILIFGNGGSASQASHFAGEFVNRFYFDRGTLPALALTTDISVISSIANDSHYSEIFSRQIEALGKPGDTVIGLTTSGSSENVLKGLSAAKKIKMGTICLCGKETQNLNKSVTDILVPVLSKDTPLIQEIHLFVLHFFAEVIENYFYKSR